MTTSDEFEALKYGKHSHATVFGRNFGVVRQGVGESVLKYRGRHRVWAAITTYTRTETVGKPIDLGNGIAATRTVTFQRTTGSGKTH